MATDINIRFGPSGIHIFNRQSGLNILLDEVQVPSELWASAPRQVSIALTNVCDLECNYCFAPKIPAKLKFDNVINWIDGLNSNGCIGIGFGGGEPTLYKYLPELCQYISQNTSLAVTLTTHAHHFNNSLASRLSGNVHFIRVSMDGVGETYELLRGRPFTRFLQCVEYVKSVAPFGINYVVNSWTLSNLNDAISLATDLGASEFLLLPERSVNDSAGIDIKTMSSFINWVHSYRGVIPLTVSQSSTYNLETCDPFDRENSLQAYAHIDAFGVLKRTSFEKYGIPIEKLGIIEAIKRLKNNYQYGEK